MLEDLDLLATRLKQLVQRMRALQTERQTLQLRLDQAVQERDVLRGQLAQLQAAQQGNAQLVAEHAAQLEQTRQEAQAAQTELQLEVSRCQQAMQVAQQDLFRSQTQTENLRSAALAAQQRIDAVLQRLPGESGDGDQRAASVSSVAAQA